MVTGDRPAETVWDAFAQTAARHGERPFLRYIGPEAESRAIAPLSFAEAHEEVAVLADAYRQAGFGPGHRIGLALDNTVRFFLHFLAINHCGASIAPLNCAMRESELAQLVALAELDLVVSLPRHDAFVQRTLDLAAVPADRGVIDGAPLPPAPAVTAPTTSAAEREAAMIFTSGTTGKPKGCVLSNAYFLTIGAFYPGLGGHCAFDPAGDRIVTPLPVTHMNALACSFLAAIRTGSCLIQLDRFHASTWWQTLRETEATIVHYLGVMPAILLQAPLSPGERAGLSVRFGFGAGVDPRHHAIFEERFGFPLIEAWAMSETGAGAWITANQEPRHVGQRCIGKPPADLDWRLIGEDERDVAATGLPGELLVRAKGDDPRRGFFSGYHRDPAATEDAWAGGWFHTGDIVRADAEGSLFFVDRKKNIVRRSGENIASVEVEGVLLQHPLVGACAVLPVADEIRGEEVMALVVPAAAGLDAAAAQAMADFCAQHLAYYKAPGWIAFVEELPTTASQKLQRGEILKIGRALHAAGEAHDLRQAKRKP